MAQITRNLRPGAIIVVHETSRAGVPQLALLAQLLDRLAQEDYACVIPPTKSLRGGRRAA